MYISYDYYRIFYYVAKYGNLSQAAKQLLNNQPNMTRAIKNLEGELGCPLFLRTNRGMKLTPEGERLYAHVRIAFEHIEAGEAEITESRTLQTGTVYVAASEVALRCPCSKNSAFSTPASISASATTPRRRLSPR